MKPISRTVQKLVPAILGSVLICFFFSTVQAYSFFLSYTGQPFTWKQTTLPQQAISWNVAPDAPPMVRDAMLQAIQAWAAASRGAIAFVEAPGGIDVVWDDEGDIIPDSTHLAWTQMICKMDQSIVSARIIINASAYAWERGGGGVRSTRLGEVSDLDGTLLHELGHALGMNHSDCVPEQLYGHESTTDLPTMNSILEPGAESLHVDDEAGILKLYAIQETAPATELVVSASPSKGRKPLLSTFYQTGGDDQTVWDFGDGITAVGASVAHKFTTSGVYTVTVQSNGKKGTVTVEVEKGGKAKKVKKPRRK
ncbi:MAG TPA: PKD domain-containing protein [Planctomycetota bacterium]|nr:PKD domain-containing protein [Planctomycetota bacterium]